jgi:hypothetical protein
MFNELSAQLMPLLTKGGFYLLSLWPIWVPMIVVSIGWHFWMEYIRRNWIKNQGYILLEIRIPKEQVKSPAAMELVLQGIWENANISTPADAFWEGKLREWFSLEIVALNGEVRFFIWAFPRWKKIIENRIYAQYPGAEVYEAKDYMLDFHYDPKKISVSSVQTELVKADPYPINTYIEWELDKKKGDEQEEIVDPLTPIIEFLGSFQPHEFGVYQIMIRAHAGEDYLYGRLGKKKDWSGDIKKTIEEIVNKEAIVKPEKDKPASLMALTDDQKHAIAAIERNAGKLAFDSMVRLVYIAPEGKQEKTRMMGMIGSMRQFGSKNLNGIKPTFPFGFTHPWQDFNGIRKTIRMSELIDAMKRRAFFGYPYHHLHGKPYVLTTEEVATIFHIPGSVATTPTLVRAASKKAEAPANLPL